MNKGFSMAYIYCNQHKPAIITTTKLNRHRSTILTLNLTLLVPDCFFMVSLMKSRINLHKGCGSYLAGVFSFGQVGWENRILQ